MIYMNYMNYLNCNYKPNFKILHTSFRAIHIYLDKYELENGDIKWYVPSLEVDDFVCYECKNTYVSDFKKAHPDCVDCFQMGDSVIYINKKQEPLINNKTFFQHIKEGYSEYKYLSNEEYQKFLHKYGEYNFNDSLIKYGRYIKDDAPYEYAGHNAKYSFEEAYELIKEQNLKFSSFEEMFNILSLKARGENLEDDISVDVLEQYLSEYFVSYRDNNLQRITDRTRKERKDLSICYDAGRYMLPQIRLKHLKHFFKEQGRQDLLNVIDKYQKLHHLRDFEYLFKVNKEIENVQLKNGENVIIMNTTDKSERCSSMRDFIFKYPYGQESLQILIYPSGKAYYRYANKKLDGSVESITSSSPYEIICSIKNYDFFKHISEKVNIIKFFDKLEYDYELQKYTKYSSYYDNIQDKFMKENEINSFSKLGSKKSKNTENELNKIPINVNIDVGNLFLVPFNSNEDIEKIEKGLPKDEEQKKEDLER